MTTFPTPKVAVLVGSLRKDSINRRLAAALQKLARGRLNLEIVELGELPLFNQDLEGDLPAPVERFKRQIENSDAVLFVTPEYLRSPSAVLKNALEWGVRPWGRNSWSGKPGAIVGASLGQIGTAVAQSHLRSIAPVLEIALISQPEIYLALKPDQIDANGDVADENLRALLHSWVGKFSDWVDRLAPAPLAAVANF